MRELVSRTGRARCGAIALVMGFAVSGCGSFGVRGSSPAPSLRTLAVESASGRDAMPYRVFLPPGYPTAAPYPVVYFLHDYYGGSAIVWRQGVADTLTREMSAGRLAPFVLVAPEGGRGFWSDRADGRKRYESWVEEDLRAAVERDFAVRRDRGGRAVTGISMGGFGAIKLALRRPDLYVAASSLSGALLPLDRRALAGYPRWTRRQLADIFGAVDDPRSTLAANDLPTLLSGVARASAPRLLFRCGAEDKYDLARLARDLASSPAADGLGIETVFEPGGHDWRYWRASFPAVLAWHAEKFAPPVPGAARESTR